jgi:predicted amidophosphoribosyltransferase
MVVSVKTLMTLASGTSSRNRSCANCGRPVRPAERDGGRLCHGCFGELSGAVAFHRQMGTESSTPEHLATCHPIRERQSSAPRWRRAS